MRFLGAALVVLALPSLARAAPSVAVVRETQKIRPTDPPPTSQMLTLSCAGNEFCAFQVAVSADATGPLSVTNVVLADLQGSCGTLSAGNAMVYREGFLDVATPSNQDGATGLWPDPLIPVTDVFYGETRNALPAMVPVSQTQPFWVEVLVPPNTAADTYVGSITVSTSVMPDVTLPISIQVRGFNLPSTSSLRSAYGMDWDGPCVGHFGGYGGTSCDDAQLEALNALYFKDALNHRITISSLVYAPPITNGMGDFTSFDTLYGPFLDGTAIGQPGTLQGAAITAIAYTGDRVSASYAAWATHFKAKGWFDKLFDYTCDEPPNGCNWTDIPSRAAIVHAGDPDLRTLTTTTIQAAQANNVLSSLDILVPIINEMYGTSTDPYPGDQRSSYDAFLMEPNKLLWMYQSCEPSSSCSNGTVEGYSGWPTLFIDETALSNRMMQWMEFAYQASGDLYYDTTYAMSQPTNDAWTSQYEFGNNGDGSLFYPGKPSVIGGMHDIPIESIRMKMIREGMQDYEYLNLLVTLKDTSFAQTELAKVVTNAGTWVHDPAVLEQVREEMANEIEAVTAHNSCDAGPGLTLPEGGSDDGSLDNGGPPPFGDDSPGCRCGIATTSSLPWGLVCGFGLLLARRRRRE